MWVRAQHGYTMLELVLVLAISSLLSTGAALAARNMLETYRLNQGTSSLVAAIRDAQVRALQEQRPWRVLLDSDGGGYIVQYAPPGTLDLTCDTTGWTDYARVRFYPIVRVATTSRSCVPFGASGRAEWPNTEVTAANPLPYTGAFSLPRLTDGWEVKPGELPPSAPTGDFRVVSWRNQNPTVELSFGEDRALAPFCVGLLSYPNNAKYPKVKAEAFNSTTTRLLYDGAGPADPPAGQRAKACFPIPGDDSGAKWQGVRITFTRNSQWILTDEVSVGNLFITLAGPDKSRTLTIAPVTGRVTVR